MSNTSKNRPRVSGNPALRAAGSGQVPPGFAGRTPPPPPSQPAQVPPDPGLPPDVLRMLRAQLEQLMNQNIQDIQRLEQNGITFDMGQVINGRIDSLIASVARAFGPQGQVWELQAKIAFEEAMAQNLQQARENGRKAQLAQAGSFSAGAIREIARATGTYGGK